MLMKSLSVFVFFLQVLGTVVKGTWVRYSIVTDVHLYRFDRLTGGLDIVGADQFFLSHCHSGT
jgi:hypothetical protein